MNYDYPVPPHYYKEFEHPDSMAAPNLKRLSKINDHFFALGGLETFRDEREKVFPDYLIGRTDLTDAGKCPKENLIFLVEELHKCTISYVKAIGENPKILEDIKQYIDLVVHNLFFLLKKVRVKQEAKHNLTQIYDAEMKVLVPNIQAKIDLLKGLLDGPIDEAYQYKRVKKATAMNGIDEELENLVIHSEKSSMDVEHDGKGNDEDNYSQFGGSYSAGD